MNKLLFMFLLIGFLAFGQDDYLVSYTQGSTAAPEYFTANAATPSPGEVNGTAGFTQTGTNYNITSVSSDVQDGTYAIDATLNADNDSVYKIILSLTGLTNGGNYTVTFYGKRNATGSVNCQMRLASTGGWTTSETTSFFTTSYVQYSETATTNSTTPEIEFYTTSNGDTGEGFKIDNIVITEN